MRECRRSSRTMSPVQPYCLPLPSSHEDPGPVPELRMRLRGPPRIALGDVPLRFQRRKAVALLAYLALTGRVHTLYALCAQVADYLLLTRQTIALNPERPLWLDGSPTRPQPRP